MTALCKLDLLLRAIFPFVFNVFESVVSASLPLAVPSGAVGSCIGQGGGTSRCEVGWLPWAWAALDVRCEGTMIGVGRGGGGH